MIRLAKATGVLVAAAMGAACVTASAEETRPAFASQEPPAAPDYAETDAWAALPFTNDAADLVSLGSALPNLQAQAQVDVFYIHPTTDLSTAHWNGPVDDPRLNAWTDASVIARQAAAFNAAGRVYAPRYRQGASGTSDWRNPDGVAAFALAYADVKRAFEYYLARYNGGRPFILVGHSQGAAHLNRLLAEMIDGQPVQDRLVAAYSLGVARPIGEIAPDHPHISICEDERQTGCLVSWNAALSGSDVDGYRARSIAAARNRQPGLNDERLFCINPLTFRTDRPAAPAESNPGSLPGAPGPLMLGTLVVEATGARCVGGVLMVDEDAASKLDLAPLPGGSMHYHEVALFYEAIRRNAKQRADAFLEANDQKPRASTAREHD